MTSSLPALPDTPACRLAREVVAEFSSPALVNHCLRSYLWAADHAGRHGIAFDDELLFVAAMVHDLGLSPVFDSATLPFEDAGGAVGWVFAAGAGWPVPRRRRVAEIVVAHMAPEVDVAVDPEGHLLELATGLDISGRDPAAWPADLRAAVLAEYPRLGLIDEFVACFTDQARRKPDSLAGRFTEAGFADRARANPLDR
ncbi:HD domain-containing protein [Geodermatophilus sp. SYSU D01106]